MAKIIGQKIGGGSSILTTPIQVTGLKATGKDGGVSLSIDSPTEASYPYLKDYWVVWKRKSDGDILHPYDGQHMTFAKPPLVLSKNLSDLEPGSTIKIIENNVPIQFYVGTQNYQSDLNGNGNTLLVRKNLYDNRPWNPNSSNIYLNSTINTFLTSEYILLLPENIRNQIVNTNIFYTTGAGVWGVLTTQLYVFALSLAELGISNSNANAEGSALPIAQELQIAYYNGAASNQWTRTPSKENYLNVFAVNSDGTAASYRSNTTGGCRPAFCLPGTIQVSPKPDSDGDYTLM